MLRFFLRVKWGVGNSFTKNNIFFKYLYQLIANIKVCILAQSIETEINVKDIFVQLLVTMRSKVNDLVFLSSPYGSCDTPDITKQKYRKSKMCDAENSGTIIVWAMGERHLHCSKSNLLASASWQSFLTSNSSLKIEVVVSLSNWRTMAESNCSSVHKIYTCSLQAIQAAKKYTRWTGVAHEIIVIANNQFYIGFLFAFFTS